METKAYLIVATNTAQMLMINKLLKKNHIRTDLVPAPPESGTVCAIAVKIDENHLDTAKNLILENDIKVTSIQEEKKLKLQGLLDNKLGTAVTGEFISIMNKIGEGDDLTNKEIVYLFSTKRKKEIEALFSVADRIRKETVGDSVEIRGAIEFSNYCVKGCKYCGVNAHCSKVTRYRMDESEILEVARSLHARGIKTVILQSGEDPLWTSERLARLLREIKVSTGMKVTLSVGEKTYREYEMLKNAGADNYLLKIETTNREIFKNIHPDDDFDVRLECMRLLKELGYITGSGSIIGLPGQTFEDISDDILYFKDMGINMIGIGPFIPAAGTLFENLPHGDIDLTLKAVAVTRIVCQKVFLPSTTALASLSKDAQVWALKAGANTIMLINTPVKYRSKYKIFDDKNMVDMESATYAAEKAGRKLPSYII